MWDVVIAVGYVVIVLALRLRWLATTGLLLAGVIVFAWLSWRTRPRPRATRSAAAFLEATRDQRRRVDKDKRPTLVIYVPGLGTNATPRTLLNNRWLWDEHEENPLPVREILPPPNGRRFFGLSPDLGSPAYVAKTVEAIVEEARYPNARILLVGNSRGAGVLARAVCTDAVRAVGAKTIVTVVFLVGPYESLWNTLRHRHGVLGACCLTPIAMCAGFLPASLHLEAMQLPWPLLFVTSKGDTEMPPDAVHRAAVRLNGRRNFVTHLATAPHSIIGASDRELLWVRTACDTMLSLPAKDVDV
jgi:hypothetical protein